MDEERIEYHEMLGDVVREREEGPKDITRYLPDLFKLLGNLLNEFIDKEDRIKINCALGYIVAPTDIVPDESSGSFGFVDDLFISSYVLRELYEKHDRELLESCWEGDEDLLEVLNMAYEESSDILDEYTLDEDILKYAGLKGQ